MLRSFQTTRFLQTLLLEKASLACSYPLSTLLDDGSIVCVYRQGTTKHSSDGILLMQVSHDNGKTWNSPKIVFDGQKLEPRQTAEIGGPCQNTEGSLLIGIQYSRKSP